MGPTSHSSCPKPERVAVLPISQFYAVGYRFFLIYLGFKKGSMRVEGSRIRVRILDLLLDLKT